VSFRWKLSVFTGFSFLESYSNKKHHHSLDDKYQTSRILSLSLIHNH
jgi:hypothetical protein